MANERSTFPPAFYLPTAWAAFLIIGATFFRPLLQFTKDTFGPSFAFNAVGTCAVAGCLWFLWHTIKKRRYEDLRAVAVLLAAGAGSFLLPIPEERIHLLKYGLLASLLFRDLRLSTTGPLAGLLSVFGASWAGCLDEFVQYFTPNRVADVRDIAINAVGALIGTVLMTITQSTVRAPARREETKANR